MALSSSQPGPAAAAAGQCHSAPSAALDLAPAGIDDRLMAQHPRRQVEAALIGAALEGRDLAGLLEAGCTALVAAGLPLARAAAGTLLLHPELNATLAIWRRQ